MNRIRWFFLPVLALATLLPAASCGKRKPPVIAVVPKGQTQDYWKAVHAGALAAGLEFGVEIRWNGPSSEKDVSRQIGILDEFISQRIQGIVLAPGHGDSLIPMVERASQEHIPVSIIDSGIHTEKYISYVSTDNYGGGALAARRMGLVVKSGKIAMISNIPGSVSTEERERGFRETLAREAPAIQLAESQYGMAAEPQSQSAVHDILLAHPDLAGIFCSNEAATVGAMRAAKGLGLSRRPKIIGFDASAVSVEGLRSGTLDALVVQDPFRMGYLGVKAVVDFLRSRTPEKRLDTGAVLITSANLDDPKIKDLVYPPVEKYLPRATPQK
jgi:ribose transport system substrate-binding protein